MISGPEVWDSSISMASSAAIRTSFIPRCLRTRRRCCRHSGTRTTSLSMIWPIGRSTGFARNTRLLQTSHSSLYFAPGNSHAPHQATKDWIAKFKGQFDQGWDKVREETLARQIRLGVVPAGTILTPRPKEIPAWDSLNDDQKKVYARMMEVYAATVGRV